MLSSVSERLKFLVAFRPGLTSPFLAAQMAGTFQNLSGGRLLLNVVTGGESHEQRMFGDFLDKDGRYDRCDEFLTIVRRLWTGEHGDVRGQAPPPRGRRARADPRPAAGDLLRWLVAGRRPGRGQARRRLPHLGRAAGGGRREGRLDPQSPPRPRVARSASASGCTPSPATPPRRRGPRRTGCSRGSTTSRSPRVQTGLKRSESVGPAADAGAQPRVEGRPRDPPQPLGRRRPGPRRCRHRDGRQPHRDRRPDRGVRARSASRSSSSPATPTSRRPTGSARACCPSSTGVGSGSTRRRSDPSPRCRSARRGRPRRDELQDGIPQGGGCRRQPQAEEPHARRRGLRR